MSTIKQPISQRKPSVLRDPNYLTWLVSDTSKGLATGLSSFALPLLVLAITNSPSRAGIMGAIAMVIRVIATLAGGVLADRRNRITLMGGGAILGVVISAFFTTLSILDELSFLILLVIQCSLSLRGGLFDGAGETALKEIVPSEAQGRAQAANSGRDAALSVIGAPLSGFLLGVGAWAVGFLMTISYVISTLTAVILRKNMRLSKPELETKRIKEGGNAWVEIQEGFTWLWRRKDLFRVMVVNTVVNLGLNTGITTNVYSLQQAGYEPVEIGFISTAMGISMLLGAACATNFVARFGAGKLILLGLATITLSFFGLIVATTPFEIVLVLAVGVFLLPSMNAALMGYFMVATPTALLGRANSTASVLSLGALPLAPIFAGFGLDLVGRGWTIAFASSLCLVATLMAVSSTSLRGLPKESHWNEYSQKFSQS